jgi:cell division protease FtsH
MSKLILLPFFVAVISCNGFFQKFYLLQPKIPNIRCNKICAMSKYPELNHLDKQNIQRLEKQYYLKKNDYSPFKMNKYYLNYTENEDQNISNITHILINVKNNLDEQFANEFNNDITNLTQILLNIKNNLEDQYESDLEFDNLLQKGLDDLENKHETPKNGYIDPFGIFRYKNSKPSSPKSSSQKKHDDEFSNDNNFQIVKHTDTSFKDVGGYANIKNELLQTADILVNYEKYKKYNVRTPKGMIFEGPPGNGKTLLAKSFAGELNVSFIPVSGSEFSEKYVGVGASRIRDLFELAEQHKPCIIFIDEIDAVARIRGNDAVSSNSEKDQTLNQLLINLDGFKKSNGVFVIGATNRIDLLDTALMRPGRMDKNIYIGNPDMETRRAILQIHMDGKPIANDIKLDDLVEMTGGFSGAQIENLLNESMLKALRDNREIIEINDLEYIMNRIIAGWQSTESTYSKEMIDRIVIHELGHAIVGLFSVDHPKLTKVLLNLWSPKTPGYTTFDTSDENINIYTNNGLFSHLMVLLSGRIAEEVFFGFADVTTGAKHDFEEAYKLAQNMILKYGMGKQNIYSSLSEQSKFVVDQEINELLLNANNEAKLIIENAKNLITDCSHILRKEKVLKPEQIIEEIKYKHIFLFQKYDISKYIEVLNPSKNNI